MSNLPDAVVELGGKAIYDHYLFGAAELPNGKPKPKWVPGGNSDKQDEARRYAEWCLTAALYPEIIGALKNYFQAFDHGGSIEQCAVRLGELRDVYAKLNVLTSSLADCSVGAGWHL